MSKEREERTDFWDVLKQIFKSAWERFPGLILLATLLAIISAVMTTLAPKLLQRITDLLIQNPSIAVEPQFWRLAFMLGGATLLSILAWFFTSKISFYIATQVEDHWRYRVLRHFYRLPVHWHDQKDSGEVGSRMDRGGSAIYIIINDLVGQNLFISVITLFIVLIAAIIAAPKFWWIFILPLPIYLVFTYLISKRMSQYQEELNDLAHDAGRSLYDGISNVRSVKSFGKENEETGRYEKKWSKYHQHEYTTERIEFTRTSVQNFIEISMRVVLLIFCFYAVVSGEMTVGTMLMLITYQQLIFGPMTYLSNIFSRFRRVARRAAAMMDILLEDDPLADKPKAQELPDLQKEIEIKEVSFHYGKLAALEGVSFRIKAGTTTAFVGRSGSGKSTLSMLLLRFYDPSSGAILWDGIDLRDATRSSLRKQVSLVPQDTSLFNRTIKENIAYGRPGATDEEVVDAAKRAHAHEFILKLPHGYDAIIGERGVKLSGGQRQRIAIARALLLQPSLLILDESTSHLDSESEHAIQASIKELHHKTTQIIIAHRLSTVQHADQIIVLDKGTIVAKGRHAELLRKSEVYRKLHKLQFKAKG
jgi:ABC-type multidrug transport system fused ATPase/permease subunit